ncbi:hypothetical protein ScPMuIL_000942 [Solemya velum]
MASPSAQSKNMKKLMEMAIVIGGGTVFYGIYAVYSGNEKMYTNVVMPVVKLLDAETAHNFAVKAAKYKLVPRPRVPDPACLQTRVWDREFSNPIGLAAGFDKHGEAVDGLLKMGFGFVEVGSVTPLKQPGNEKPRVFRLLEDEGIINRYGFNSDGHDTVYSRLKFRESEPRVGAKGCMGVNLGKNKLSAYPVDDYVQGVKKFGKVADYLVVNISSPNTPGLREMQGREQLENLIHVVSLERNKLRLTRKPPLLVKIAPDLSDKDKEDIAAVVTKDNRVDGLVISNTTVSRPHSLQSLNKSEVGGLSGSPLKDLATTTIHDMYRLTEGKLPIIGVGGISSGKDAYEKIKAGACLVQIYTALIYQGPPVIARIKRELGELIRKDGYTSVEEAVGVDHKKKS